MIINKVNEKYFVVEIENIHLEEFSTTFVKNCEMIMKMCENSSIFNVIFNFKQLTYINTISITHLFKLHIFLKKNSGKMVIVNVESEHLKSVFHLIEINKIIPIQNSIDDALKLADLK